MLGIKIPDGKSKISKCHIFYRVNSKTIRILTDFTIEVSDKTENFQPTV